jgi:hypothetical protein
VNDFGPLFPVGKKVPEHLQIGRAGEIDRLERTTSEGQSALVFETGRVGKGSVASVEIDLRNITDLAELATALTQPLGTTLADKAPRRFFRWFSKPRRPQLTKLVETLGSAAEDLGVEDRSRETLSLGSTCRVAIRTARPLFVPSPS